MTGPSPSDRSTGADGGDTVDYRTLIDRVPAILYIAEPGPAGRFHYISPQVRSILGYTEQEWLEDPLLWERSVHPDDRESVIARERELEARHQAEPVAIEYRLLHRDGHPVWIRDDALLLSDAAGVTRWHGVWSDVSEQKLVEAELERRVAQQAAVARLGEHALERVSIDALIDEALTAVAEILEVEASTLTELVDGGDTLRLRATHGLLEDRIGDLQPLTARNSQGGFTVMTGQPVVVEDWDAEHRFEQLPPLRGRLRSGVTVLIEGSDGPFGILGALSVKPRSYATGDVAFIQALANVLADAVARQRTEAAIEHRALHDPLTGLPNRVLFIDRLEQALERLRRRTGRRVAVLFIDLDHFKYVNDSLGHHAGDELLGAVAARLRQAVRPSDTVARFGGDEFGLLLEDIGSEREAVGMAERLAAVFARPFVLEASEHFVTTSVGIALATGAERSGDLIRDADAAMYRAKERGRARYELFDEVMRARAISRLRTETDLRRAIEHDQLHIAYQPVVALGDGAIVGVEALLRWEHPDRGLLSPAEFVPVAEENGLIDRIGRWALERACRDGVQWALARPDAAPVYVAVNLSTLQISHGSFESTLAEILAATGHDPQLLSLEITESLLLDEVDAIADSLAAIKRIGARIALDDFGTGYSSLSYLNRLPLDMLKVDRTFVAMLGGESSDGAITEAIVAMARALSLTVIAEGVETTAQVQELRRLGCGYAQGNLFSVPVSAGKIDAMLRAGASLGRQLGRG